MRHKNPKTPSLKITPKGFTFNVACMQLMPDVDYVQFMYNFSKGQIYALESNGDSMDDTPWRLNCSSKKIRSKFVKWKKFYDLIIEGMNWIHGNEYTISAKLAGTDEGKQVIVLNLTDIKENSPWNIKLNDMEFASVDDVLCEDEYDDTENSQISETNSGKSLDLSHENMAKCDGGHQSSSGGIHMSNNLNHQMLALDSLVPFEGHPFETYEGQRFTDMVESIRTNGVIVPIVVRPKENGKYEILSGHNRVKAANEVKEAQGELVQAIVRDDLTDDEALLIVTETNLIQRSFADLKHSERAVALATHYDALKMKRGYRSDLLDEINALTCSPVANKSKTANKLGEQYGLAKDTIFRYIRIHELCIDLKEKLDNSEIAVRTSVSLSYLRKKEQDIIAGLISDGVKVSMKQAEFLRNESSKGELSKTAIKGFLKANEKPEKPRSIKFNERFLAQYFDEDKSNEEIEGIVAKALELYFSQINSE